MSCVWSGSKSSSLRLQEACVLLESSLAAIVGNLNVICRRHWQKWATAKAGEYADLPRASRLLCWSCRCILRPLAAAAAEHVRFLCDCLATGAFLGRCRVASAKPYRGPVKLVWQHHEF